MSGSLSDLTFILYSNIIILHSLILIFVRSRSIVTEIANDRSGRCIDYCIRYLTFFTCHFNEGSVLYV